jgi:hypothetical protein
MARKIDYNARNFSDVRTELINFVQQYYPDVFNDFNDASVGMMLLELNAAVGDMLSFHTDRMFNETQINYMQERSSLLELARTFGLQIPGFRPSITIVDWSVIVPVLGDEPDYSYAPILFKGSQATGAGKVFELLEDCDFESPFSVGGIPNQLIIPNIVNGTTESYTLVKREICLNGFTKIFKKVLKPEDYKPFLEIILPDANVLSVESIIVKEGTNITTTPSIADFTQFENRFFEVEALAQPEVFIEDFNILSDTPSVRPGKWVNAPKRFIKEFTDNGFCKIIFGAGEEDVSALNDFIGCRGQIDRIGNIANNLSLGEIPPSNNTMFIKYRVGGGSASNVGNGVINGLGTVNFYIDGDDATINRAVRDSLSVNNPIPAIGGKNAPSIEEIRNLIRYNFSAQNRAVTIKDYQSRIALMPGRFGVPFRCGVWEERNKVQVTILTLDSNGKLKNQSNSTIKENIAEYLADYRMLNDYVVIKDGKIVNVGFEFDLFVEKSVPKTEIITNVVNTVNSFMDINNWEMGENIYLAQLIENVNNVGGVLNVVDMRIYNKWGENKYSTDKPAQGYLQGFEDERRIDLQGQYTLFGQPNSMFEIKYPNRDIKIRIT